MLIRPELEALRRDDTPQRQAQARLGSVLAQWRAGPAALLDIELGQFGEGAELDDLPLLSALFAPGETAAEEFIEVTEPDPSVPLDEPLGSSHRREAPRASASMTAAARAAAVAAAAVAAPVMRLLLLARPAPVAHLALAYVPLAGAGVFLGLSALTVSLLRGEGLGLGWVTPARELLLAGAALWTLRLGWGTSGRYTVQTVRRLGATLCIAAGAAFSRRSSPSKPPTRQEK